MIYSGVQDWPLLTTSGQASQTVGRGEGGGGRKNPISFVQAPLEARRETQPGHRVPLTGRSRPGVLRAQSGFSRRLLAWAPPPPQSPSSRTEAAPSAGRSQPLLHPALLAFSPLPLAAPASEPGQPPLHPRPWFHLSFRTHLLQEAPTPCQSPPAETVRESQGWRVRRPAQGQTEPPGPSSPGSRAGCPQPSCVLCSRFPSKAGTMICPPWAARRFSEV